MKGAVATAEDELGTLRRAMCRQGRHVWGRGRLGEKCCYCEANILKPMEVHNADA